jgi:hypothetical protein
MPRKYVRQCLLFSGDRRRDDFSSSITRMNTTQGYGFHFQRRNSRTFPIESLAHDSERTSVCAEYGYPKGSPDTNS